MASYNNTPTSGRIDPAEDIIVSTLTTFVGGPCRRVRCITAGTFIGLTYAGISRTVTFYAPGEVLDISFRSQTGGTGTFELIY